MRLWRNRHTRTFEGRVQQWVRVQVPLAAPSALTIGAASELIRNDGFAFLYANPGPLPPLSPVFRRNTRLGLHHGPGSFVNLSDQPRRDFNSRGFFRICRVPRVRRVIRVIRVIRVRIEDCLPSNGALLLLMCQLKQPDQFTSALLHSAFDPFQHPSIDAIRPE